MYYNNEPTKEEAFPTEYWNKKREFLDNYTKFPWSWFGWDYPMWGSVHSYLCQYLKDYIDVEAIRTFVGAKPTLREVKRAAEIFESRYLSDIVEYCDKLSENEDMFNKTIIAKAVHYYIVRDQSFEKDFTELFTKKWLRGDL